MPTINYTRPFLYPYQTEILDSPARYTCTEAATKVGKTASHIIWLFEQSLLCKKGQACWWIAPSFSQAKMAFDRMKDAIKDKSFYTANETNLLITLITGAKMQFKTGDKPDNLYGDDVYAAVMDEASRCREAAWFALRSTITSTGGKIKFIGNVKGRKNWFYKISQKAKNGGDPNYAYFRITAYDAANAGMLTKDGRPFIEEIESAKIDLPESVFKELYLAEASEDGSNPFGIQFIQQCIFPISINPSVAFGGDLAKSVDWTVEIGLDKYGSTSHFRRYQMDWRSTISSFVALPPAPTRMDSTGVGDPIVEAVQAARQNVSGFKFNQYSKQQLMEGLALAIQQKKISFPPGIIVDELESFEYEYTRTGVRYTAPAGMTDDCVCALALAYDQFKETGTGGISWI